MADPKYVQDFIAEITPYAVAVGDQFGIDPVTIITQAAVETGWGREVAGNNYFGVKSHGRPGGQNITTHEEVDGKRVRTKDSFRTYESLGESVADYGKFLSENPRYTEALKLSGPDQLQGIAAAGYATDSNYPTLVRNVAGMVQRNMRPLPPGSLPEVASLQDTRTPTLPPAPVTSSPDMAQMRRQAAPSQLVRDSFAQLPRPGGDLGGSLAMSPVQGGNQQAPMFDGIYDERINAVRPSGSPIDTQGMATMRSSAPAPVPASPFDRVTARLNALPPAAPVPASPYDRVTARLNALPAVPPPSGAGPTTRTVQSVPVRGNVPSGGFAGQERAPSTQRPMTVEQMYAGIYPEKPGDFLLGGNTPNLPTTAPTTGISPYQVAQIGVPAIPEIPGAPRTRMASAAPFPMPRPGFMNSVGTALSVQPMPPMPIPRPMVQQQRRAPMPMPASMRPFAGVPQQRAPLRITVQRDQQQSRPTPQGFTESGNGRLVSNEYGDTYYSRHLK